MIAVFLTDPDGNPVVHALLEVVRDGFIKVKAHGYCGADSNAAEGTYQTPDWIFDGRKTYTMNKGPKVHRWTVCESCTAIMKVLREPPQ
jgi:hypothetical protein